MVLLLQVQLLSSQTTATARQAGGPPDIVKQHIQGFQGPNHQHKIRSCQVLLKTARLPRDMLSSCPMRSPRLRKLTSYGLHVSYRLLTRAVRAVTVQPTKGGIVGWLNQLRANTASSAASANQRLSLLPTSLALGGGAGSPPPFSRVWWCAHLVSA
jgi:hypothetical protein